MSPHRVGGQWIVVIDPVGLPDVLQELVLGRDGTHRTPMRVDGLPNGVDGHTLGDAVMGLGVQTVPEDLLDVEVGAVVPP